MQNDTSVNGVLKDGIRDIQQAYMARFPEKATELLRPTDIERIKGMLAITKNDTRYITGIISKLNKTASGDTPGWAYVDTVIKKEYLKKTAPIQSKTDEELSAMAEYKMRTQYYNNITQQIIEDIVPAEELPIKSWDDPNIMKIMRALYEDGRLSDELLADGIRGYDLLTGELKDFGNLITSGKFKEIIPN